MVSLGDVDGQALVAGFVHDASLGAAELLLLHAGDLAVGPVARLCLPVRVPYTLLPAQRSLCLDGRLGDCTVVSR
jgi:carotenoid cleavage dioxygenase-like enzyme